MKLIEVYRQQQTEAAKPKAKRNPVPIPASLRIVPPAIDPATIPAEPLQLSALVRTRTLDLAFTNVSFESTGEYCNRKYAIDHAQSVLKLLIDHAKRTLGGER